MIDDDDDLIYGDDAVRLADFWADEYSAGVISASELRELLTSVVHGSLSVSFVGQLYWDGIVGWVEACRLAGRSAMLPRVQVFGTRRAQAAECGCWFDASNPREIADPPDWCPGHRPVIRKYSRDYLRTPHWQRTRSIHLRRHPICQHCQQRKAAEVHHTDEGYQNLWRERDEDLRALCARCHRTAHGHAVEQ